MNLALPGYSTRGDRGRGQRSGTRFDRCTPVRIRLLPCQILDTLPLYCRISMQAFILANTEVYNGHAAGGV